MTEQRINVEALKAFCKHHWGLHLSKCSSEGKGRQLGSWKSGWELSGIFPGLGYRWRRFKTLKDVARATKFFEEG